MRSSELASIAGVTVRALRHYHQVGVLPEPSRGPNGYREYGVRDLTRLLRIKRLAALGVTLEAMGAVLDSTADEHATLLDQLDAGIDAEIARLNEQKRMILLLRAHDSAPDVPPELARFIDLFAGAPDSVSSWQEGREQAVLVAHFLSQDGLQQVSQLFDRLSDPELRDDMLALSREFDNLDGDPQGPEPIALADRFLEVMRALTAGLPPDEAEQTLEERTSQALLFELQDEALNPAQRVTMERVTAGLTSAGEPQP